MIFGVIRSIAFTLVSCDMAVHVVLEVPRTVRIAPVTIIQISKQYLQSINMKIWPSSTPSTLLVPQPYHNSLKCCTHHSDICDL